MGEKLDARVEAAAETAGDPTLPLREGSAGTPSAGRAFGDYELLGEIARGGMGVVYKARQVSLNRLVALKMILAGQLAGPADVQRFRAEAEAAANLDHPNILPIYEVGERDGQHYFSMKLIDGGSLADAIRAKRLGAKQGAALLARVARAVHFAHQHGILHRDLKPANVLLDRDGNPYVTDFGLAKRVEADSALTQTGAIVGTPSYMAPEQARSQKQLSTAVDVYSLGAILYEMLTGRPPFRAATQLDTILQVVEREPDDPRKLDPTIDRDLATIALKCLNKDPAKRYGSADALAEELQRWLNGEPISARPVRSLERAWRWARRNPALSASLAALALAILAGAAVSTAFGLRSHQKARQALDALDAREQALRDVTRERDRANRREQETREAIREYFTEVSSNPELQAVGLEPLRRKLLAKPLAYYRQFVAERGDDPELRAELASAHFELALIIKEIGNRNEAVAELEQALALYRALSAERPDDAAVRRGLAGTLHRLGIVYREVGRLAEAKAVCQEAIERLRDELAAQPGDLQLSELLAATYTTIAAVLAEEGVFPAQRDYYQKALVLRRAAAKAHPGDPRDDFAIGETLYNLGSAYMMAGLWKEAEQSYQDALAIWRRLHKAHPGEAGGHHQFGSTLCNLGLLFYRTNRPDKALESWTEARDVLQRLVDAHPTVTEFQHDLATAYMNLASALDDEAHSKQSEEAQARALTILQKLADDHPSVTQFAIELGGVLCNQGNVHLKRNKPQEALRQYDRAIAALGGVLKQAPGQPRAREFLANSRGGRAAALMDLKRFREALGDWNEVVKLLGSGMRVELRLDRLSCLAEIDRDAALREVDELASRPLSAADHYQLAGIMAKLAGADDKLAARAVERLRLAVDKGFRDADQLRKDKDFEPLRKRDDFQRLVRDLEAKAKPGKS